MVTYHGRTLMPGRGQGPVVAISPLSLWGGLDPVTGLVIDRSHPALGRSLAGTVLVMASGRGSSSSSSVIAEALRLGTAPAAIILAEPDAILVIGAMVADALYQRSCPIVVLAPEDHAALAAVRAAEVGATDDGAVVTVS
jgi:predicted aconitase with swiveling domain